MSKNKLIVQIKTTESSNYEDLIYIEETLIQAFVQNPCAVVDGHDMGQGKFNIFIFHKGSCEPVIERVKAFLKLRGALQNALIVKKLKSERYVVVWPEGHKGAFEI